MAWGYLLTGPVVFVVMLVTTQAAIAAEASAPGITALAYSQGATSVPAWIAQDDLGGAIVILTGLSTVSMLGFLILHALSRVIRMARAATRREPRPAM